MLRCVAMSIPRLTAIPPLSRQVLLLVALSAMWWMKQKVSTAVSCSRYPFLLSPGAGWAPNQWKWA